MNEMRKLMEMVEAGEYGSVPTSKHDVEIDGQGIILYEDQVAIYDESGEYQIFLPIETWNAFKKAGSDVAESINEDQEPVDVMPITPITDHNGDTYKFNAVKYDMAPNDLSVKIWEPNRDVMNESIEIDYHLLKRIVDAIEGQL